MNDYHQYLDNQYQENRNGDIEIPPNSEINPSHNRIVPPENIHMNMNLTARNPAEQNLSLNNQSNQNNGSAKKDQNKNININNNGITQMNREIEPNDLENNCLFNMNYDGDDKLNMEFYPDLLKVEVNKTSTCYQMTENLGTELAEQSAQEETIHIMRVDDDTHDETMRNN